MLQILKWKLVILIQFEKRVSVSAQEGFRRYSATKLTLASSEDEENAQ